MNMRSTNPRRPFASFGGGIPPPHTHTRFQPYYWLLAPCKVLHITQHVLTCQSRKSITCWVFCGRSCVSDVMKVHLETAFVKSSSGMCFLKEGCNLSHPLVPINGWLDACISADLRVCLPACSATSWYLRRKWSFFIENTTLSFSGTSCTLVSPSVRICLYVCCVVHFRVARMLGDIM